MNTTVNTTDEQLKTVNELEPYVHGTADEDTLIAWRAEVGVKARAANELGTAVVYDEVSVNGVVATPEEAATLTGPDHDNR